MPADPSGTSELDAASCWSRLGDSGIGRLAVTADDGPSVTPIDYLVHDGRLYFRSSPGTKLQPCHTPAVAGSRWRFFRPHPVDGRGPTSEIEESGVLAVHPTAGGARRQLRVHGSQTVTGPRSILPQPATDRRGGVRDRVRDAR